jgi:hypothetical protein
MKQRHSLVVRVITACLMLSIGAPAFAGDLTDSAARAASSLAEQQRSAGKRVGASFSQARPNASGSDENPYFIASIALMGAGGLVAIYGLTHETGIECTGSGLSVACSTTKSTGTAIAGVAIAGVGAFLFYRGEQQKKSSPEIVAGPHGITLRQHLRW